MAGTKTTYAKNLNTVISWDTDFVYMNLVYKNMTNSYSIDAVYEVDHNKLKNTIQPNNHTYRGDIFYDVDIDSTYYTTLSYTLSILDKNYNNVELKYPIKILNYPAYNVFVDTHELQLYSNAITYIYTTATNGTNENDRYVYNVTPLIYTSYKPNDVAKIYPAKLVENNNLLPNKLSNYKLNYAYMYKIPYSAYSSIEYFDFKPIGNNIDNRITERVYIDNKDKLPILHNAKNITDNILYDLSNIYTNSSYICNVNNLFDIETRINDVTIIKKLSDGIKNINNKYFSIQLNKNIYLPEYYVTVKNESNADDIRYELTNFTYIQNSNMYDIYRYDLCERGTNNVVATAYSSKTYSYPVLKNQHNIEYNIYKRQGDISLQVKRNNNIKISYAYSINNFILNDTYNLFNAAYITYCGYQYSYYPGPSTYSYDYNGKRYTTSNNCIQLCIGDNEFINRNLDNIYVIKDDEFIVNDSFIWNKPFFDNNGKNINPHLDILLDNVIELTSNEQNNVNNFVLHIDNENSFNNVFNSLFDIYVHNDNSVIFRLKTNIYNVSYFMIPNSELNSPINKQAQTIYDIVNSNDIQKYNVKQLFFDSVIYITKKEQYNFNYIFVVELNVENNSNIKNILVLQSNITSYKHYEILNMGISNNFLLSNKFDNVVYDEYMSDSNPDNITYVNDNIKYLDKVLGDYEFNITVDDIYLNKLYNCCDNEFYLVENTDIMNDFPNNTVVRHGDQKQQELVYKKYNNNSTYCFLLKLGKKLGNNNKNSYYNYFNIFKTNSLLAAPTVIDSNTYKKYKKYKWMFSYESVCQKLFDHYYNNDNIYQIMHYDWHANSYINTFNVKDIKKSRQYINSICDNKILNYSEIAYNNIITDDIIGLYKTVEDFNGLNFEASYTKIFSLRPIIKPVNLYNYNIVKNYTIDINNIFINDNIIKCTDVCFKEYYNVGDFEFKLNIDTRDNLLSFNICVLFIYIDDHGNKVYLVWDNGEFKILAKSINNTLSVKINYYSQKITIKQSKYCERDARRDPSRDKKDVKGNTLYAWFCNPITIELNKDGNNLKQTLNSITLYSSKINLKPHFDTLLDINTSIQHKVVEVKETTDIGVFTIPLIHNNYDNNVNYVMLNEIFNYINNK
jgi:hypothetical protein